VERTKKKSAPRLAKWEKKRGRPVAGKKKPLRKKTSPKHEGEGKKEKSVFRGKTRVCRLGKTVTGIKNARGRVWSPDRNRHRQRKKKKKGDAFTIQANKLGAGIGGVQTEKRDQEGGKDHPREGQKERRKVLRGVN